MEEDFKKGNHIKSHLYMYSDQLLFKSVRPGVFLACDLLKHSLLVLLLFSLMLTFFAFSPYSKERETCIIALLITTCLLWLLLSTNIGLYTISPVISFTYGCIEFKTNKVLIRKLNFIFSVNCIFLVGKQMLISSLQLCGCLFPLYFCWV